jgi:hypothetical protein
MKEEKVVIKRLTEGRRQPRKDVEYEVEFFASLASTGLCSRSSTSLVQALSLCSRR